MTTYARNRSRNPLSLDALENKLSMMSDESLREIAARERGFEMAVAKRLLRERDLEVGLAE